MRMGLWPNMKFATALSGIIFLSLSWQSAYAARCMLVMSYHQGYAWNDGIQQGVKNILTGKCDLKIFYMDTKRNKSIEHAELAAIKAKAVIDEYDPDVLIASDDNASRYLVTKYYRDAKLPVVFCAVNWDVSKYGYPYSNVTGMIEVAPIQPVIEVAKKLLGDVKEMAYLGASTYTQRKNTVRITDVLKKQGISTRVLYAKNITEWKQHFIDAQSADFIMLGSTSGIDGWVDADVEEFVLHYAKKLTLANHDWMASYTMYTMSKVPEEQGEWAAEAAMAIVNGMSPRNIPIGINKKWKIFINTPLLHKANISIDREMFTDVIEVESRDKK